MGRRKIDIVRIDNARHRLLTYTNRKQGLIRKATELAVLCGAEVGIIIFGADEKKMTVYSSSSIDTVVERWRKHEGEPEVITTEQYFQEKALKRDAEAAFNDVDPSEAAMGLSYPPGPPVAHMVTPMAQALPSYMCVPDPHMAYGHSSPYAPPHPNGAVQPSPPGYAYHTTSAAPMMPSPAPPYPYPGQPVQMTTAPPRPVHPQPPRHTCYVDESAHAPPMHMAMPHGRPPMHPVPMRAGEPPPPGQHAPHSIPPPQMPMAPQMAPQPVPQHAMMPPPMAPQPVPQHIPQHVPQHVPPPGPPMPMPQMLSQPIPQPIQPGVPGHPGGVHPALGYVHKVE